MGAEAIIALILGLVDRIAQYGALIAKAKAEGRDVTAAELNAIREQARVAEGVEQAAIDRAIAEGR